MVAGLLFQTTVPATHPYSHQKFSKSFCLLLWSNSSTFISLPASFFVIHILWSLTTWTHHFQGVSSFAALAMLSFHSWAPLTSIATSGFHQFFKSIDLTTLVPTLPTLDSVIHHHTHSFQNMPFSLSIVLGKSPSLVKPNFLLFLTCTKHVTVSGQKQSHFHLKLII